MLGRVCRVLLAVVLFTCPTLFGQGLTYGAVVGVPLTKDFNSFYDLLNGSPFLRGKSDSRGIIVGPKLEWSFVPQISLEADAIYRELRFSDVLTGNHNPTVTWEFPILAKYRFRSNRSSYVPFIEAGPSFRTTGNLNANPSHVGVSAGAGLDFRFHHLALAPTLRYTRWARDSHPYGIESRPDQLELLVDLSYSPDSQGYSPGRHVQLGVILGTNLLGDYANTSRTSTDLITGNQTTFSSRSGPRSVLAGPAFEFQLARKLSVEADAIYRPVRERYKNISISDGHTSTTSGESTLTTWRIPVLAKYTLPVPRTKNIGLFFEAGPSFRLSGGLTHFGITGGAGVSTRVSRFCISPVLRYTRWQRESTGQIKTDDLSVLVSLTF